MYNFHKYETKGRVNHYIPVRNKIGLDKTIYRETSIADAAIAAHEASHALQDDTLDKVTWIQIIMKVITFLSGIVGIVSLVPLIFFDIGNFVELVWKIYFITGTLYATMSLFFEIDASRRAISELKILGIIKTKKEKFEVINVLSTAFLTYVCSFLFNLFFLLSFVF